MIVMYFFGPDCNGNASSNFSVYLLEAVNTCSASVAKTLIWMLFWTILKEVLETCIGINYVMLYMFTLVLVL